MLSPLGQLGQLLNGFLFFGNILRISIQQKIRKHLTSLLQCGSIGVLIKRTSTKKIKILRVWMVKFQKLAPFGKIVETSIQNLQFLIVDVNKPVQILFMTFYITESRYQIKE